MHSAARMNALDLLKSQHDEVKDLFEEIQQTEDDDEKEALFQELADNLAAHATIEEKIFYPAAYAKETKELLKEAVEEHLAMKRVIADLLPMMPRHAHFDAKLRVLKEQVEHHVDEEERELFKAARQELGDEALETLGLEMKALFDDEMKGVPSALIPEQTSRAAPLK